LPLLKTEIVKLKHWRKTIKNYRFIFINTAKRKKIFETTAWLSQCEGDKKRKNVEPLDSDFRRLGGKI
jgi:hypothetical protein